MSPCSGSMCLLVLLGAVMALGNPVHSQESLDTLLKLTDKEVGSKPLFTSVIRSINTSCQRKEDIKLMNATLDVYMRIFSSILSDSSSVLLKQVHDTNDRSRVLLDLKGQRQKMEELRGNLTRVHHGNEHMISQLSKIKVDDPLDQRRALAEFEAVSRVASRFAGMCSP